MTYQTDQKSPADKKAGMSESMTRKKRQGSKRQAEITEAAVEVIAREGIEGLSHRELAKEAQISLAATTYYFESKSEILFRAAEVALVRVRDCLCARLHLVDGKALDPVAFRDLTIDIILNAVGPNRTATLCWYEIVLNAARQPGQTELVQNWFGQLPTLDLPTGSSSSTSHEPAAGSFVDAVIGLILMAIALDLSDNQIRAVLSAKEDPLAVWAIAEDEENHLPKTTRTGVRSASTRAKIVDVAIDTLVADGIGAVGYRAIAIKSGLTPGGPFYHFPTIVTLLNAARVKLLEDLQARRTIAVEGNVGTIDSEYVLDRMTMVFLREATESSAVNVASYLTWIDAGRQPALRVAIWRVMAARLRDWQWILGKFAPQIQPFDSLIVEATYLGKLIRILGTGSRESDLVMVRREFAHYLKSISQSSRA